MSAPFDAIPPTLEQFVVPMSVLQETRELLAGPGIEGYEAVVLWLGVIVSAIEARVLAAYLPRQITYKTRRGLAVEIPPDERTRIALSLSRGTFVLAKLHTHAGRAYHSPTDAANPYLNHEGAVAITVPHFAQAPVLDLTSCSVNIFRNQYWCELSVPEIRRWFRVIDEVNG